MNLDRIERYPAKFGAEDYKVESSLVAMCDVYNKAKICRCGFPNRNNPSGRCSQRWFCSHCAEVKAKQAVSKFRPFFHRGAWCHATLSWSGWLQIADASFDDPLPDDPMSYWEACTSAVKGVVAKEWVQGAYWAEQLHVETLWPSVRVTAHVHVLFHARDASVYSSCLEAELADRMAAYRCRGDVQPRLKPDVLLKSLTHRQHYEKVVGYLHHPVKLSHVYERGWEDSGAARRRSRAQELNANLQEYYHALKASTFGRHTVGYTGTLDPRRKIYLGRGRSRKRKPARKSQKQDES
jgi:hypothetical protein